MASTVGKFRLTSNFCELTTNLAGLYVKQGKDAQAEPLAKRALEIRQKTAKANDHALADARKNYSTVKSK